MKTKALSVSYVTEMFLPKLLIIKFGSFIQRTEQL
jgi:hypothetical protein